ncbi:hypothetical protein RJ641_022107 [Dillenia turbinata]|uniref:WRKY domain-containing protein n=1 Tax=Dillenia turbinata TaxID=194707 RepID=A0AAN8UJW1_9MAGN
METTNMLGTFLDFDLNINPLYRNDETLERVLEEDRFAVEEAKVSIEKLKVLEEELNRVSDENKKLTGMLTMMCENKIPLKEVDVKSVGKRKSDFDENNNVAGLDQINDLSSSDEDSCKRPKQSISKKVSRVFVKVDKSDSSLLVKDGYQWRKDGKRSLKIIHLLEPISDVPLPQVARSKRSKKVQRSAEDQSVLIATYEGEHNHLNPSESKMSLVTSPLLKTSLSPGSISTNSSESDLTLNMVESNSKKRVPEFQASPMQRVLIKRMASSLTSDPSYMAALAAAILGRILDQTRA